MRVFPFKSLEAVSTGKPALAGSFIVDYPCVIGRFGVVGKKGDQRNTWLEIRQWDMAMRTDRAGVTKIETPERLDQILNVLATLGWTDGMFVEPYTK